MKDIVRFLDRFDGTKESILILAFCFGTFLVIGLIMLAAAGIQKLIGCPEEVVDGLSDWGKVVVVVGLIASAPTAPFAVFAMQNIPLSEAKYSVIEFVPVQNEDCISLTVQNEDGTEAELVFSLPNATIQDIPAGTTRITELETDSANDCLIIRRCWGKKEIVLESCLGSELNDFVSAQKLKLEIKNGF